MFELTHLRCFVVLAEELHFGRAAERLHMTQSPLSRQIQVLERILGVELFNRTSRRVTLTLAGETFLHEARRIVRLSESAALAARRVWKGRPGASRSALRRSRAMSCCRASSSARRWNCRGWNCSCTNWSRAISSRRCIPA
ncbi:LysR family transcriptional regulator [Novosphingobium resinovorum]